MGVGLRIGLINLGGNLGSVRKWLRAGGMDPEDVETPEGLMSFDLIVMPGSGNADAHMQRLSQSGVGESIRDFARSNGKVLGICLGAQLMFEESEETSRNLLGLLPGKVTRIPGESGGQRTGWAPLEAWSHRKLPVRERFFFNHSYSFRLQTSRPDSQSAVFRDASLGLESLVVGEQFLAAQFHPEKSQIAGVIFREFVIDWVRGQ